MLDTTDEIKRQGFWWFSFEYLTQIKENFRGILEIHEFAQDLKIKVIGVINGKICPTINSRTK